MGQSCTAGGEQTGIEQNALDGAEGEAGQYLVMLISRENAVPKRAKASCEFMSSGATAAPAAPYGVWDVREATRSRGGLLVSCALPGCAHLQLLAEALRVGDVFVVLVPFVEPGAAAHLGHLLLPEHRHALPLLQVHVVPPARRRDNHVSFVLPWGTKDQNESFEGKKGEPPGYRALTQREETAAPLQVHSMREQQQQPAELSVRTEDCAGEQPGGDARSQTSPGAAGERKALSCKQPPPSWLWAQPFRGSPCLC